MSDYINNYCERLAPGFWDEPLNAITNAAFLIAAFLVFRLACKKDALDTAMIVMIGMLCAIGVGSFLFHTLATGWAMIADTTPILFFQIGFLGIYAARVIGFRAGGVAVLLGLFFVHVVLFGMLPAHWLNGSVGYIPAIDFLLVLAVYHWYARKTERFGLLLAAVVFMVSLTLRTIDAQICPTLSFGTHFLWHCLNAVVLYLCLRVLIRNKLT